jgi:hypothetical protein
LIAFLYSLIAQRFRPGKESGFGPLWRLDNEGLGGGRCPARHAEDGCQNKRGHD